MYLLKVVICHSVFHKAAERNEKNLLEILYYNMTRMSECPLQGSVYYPFGFQCLQLWWYLSFSQLHYCFLGYVPSNSAYTAAIDAA